ncbi:MAG: hypothetical protein H0T76_29260 [Nannocystis sp.]|nr:hypothetical protein [Nannocystis sp.]MBA3550584.1 hypothetical protein [Nannocystis sp.]
MATRITRESLEAAGVGPEALAALARQTRGGAAGSGGFGYEDQFAIASLITHSVGWFERGEDCLLTVGHPHCWVDDVVVERTDSEEYSQLKTSPGETWGKDDGRLHKLFRLQVDVCRARRVREFRLQVVTPHEDRLHHFNTQMPESLRDSTRAVLFPDKALGWNGDGPVAKALGELCADQPEPSVRELLLRAITGAYHWMHQNGATAWKVSEVTAEVAKDERIPLRSAAHVANVALWEAATAALRGTLPNLRLRLTRGFLVYEYSDDERGLIARADSDLSTRFLARLAKRAPTTLEQFHEELP